MKKVSAILLGAGGRGNVYSRYAKECPEEFEVVAVAEPDEARRDAYCAEFGIPANRAYESWEVLLSQPKMADAAMVCTMDDMHTAPALKALELGYHVLLEKPMSIDAEECEQIAQAADKEGLVLSVCHVLRYAPFYTTLKDLLDSKTVGDPLVIQQTEQVGYWHYAHSFVRGNWRNSEESCPMILAKCCHDTDILSWLLGRDAVCTGVSSYGSLTHFKPENAPENGTDRCLGCPAAGDCLYYAPRFYLEHPRAIPDNFAAAVTTDTSREGILKALETSPYGRCVYRCDNDVVDHQVVNAVYSNSAVVSLVMTAFTQECNRLINITGTKGEISGDMGKNELICRVFGEKEPRRIAIRQPELKNTFNHEGGDFFLMRDFVRAIRHSDPTLNRTTARQSLQSHLICFAAEKSRLTGKSVAL